MIGWAEAAARLFDPPKNAARWVTPGDFAREINPKTYQTPALDLIDAALVEAFNTPDSRLIITMAPQEGKSTRVAQDFPVWCLTQNPELRIVTASYSSSLAVRNGRAIRSRATRAGLDISRDNGSVQDWTLESHDGGVFSIGIGGGVSGRPADMLVIDDPIKSRMEAESITYRDKNWDWWLDEASARLAPGAPVVMILTRWHEDDLAGRLIDLNRDAGWVLLNIPAQADHDPAKGETDVLDREPGEFMVSARRRTQKQWENRKSTAGSRTWNALYQGRPAPVEGGMFKRSDWKRYDYPLWTGDAVRTVTGETDVLVMSWDMAFKDSKTSDYVVGQVWLGRGPNVYLLDMVRKRLTFTETLAAVKTMVARWPQCSTKLVEDKANGTAILDVLKKEMSGLIPITPHESKEARAAAVSPFVEAGNVFLPAPGLVDGWDPADLIEEAASFPNAAHDDTVDALTQALQRMLVRGGQGSAFLAAMKARAEANGTEIPTATRNWRERAQNLKEAGQGVRSRPLPGTVPPRDR